MNTVRTRMAVTGAAGFIGRHTVALLREQGCTVDEWDVAGVAAPLDLLDIEAVGRRLIDFQPEAIIHLAAVGVRHAQAHDPDCIVQAVRMNSALLAALRAHGSSLRLVATGSMAEYGQAPSPFREDSACFPETAYAIGKLAATQYLLAYGQTAKASVCVARLFGVYGPGEAPGRLFPTLLTRLRAGDPVPLSDGKQVRDFIHVRDVASALFQLANHDYAGVVNVCTGKGVRIRDVAQWIADALNADPGLLRFGEVPRSPGDRDHIVGDPTRIQALLGSIAPQRLVNGLDLSDIVGTP